MASNEVPSFKEIWDAVPQSAAPRTLDAAIAFLDQIDGAIDLDDAQLKVYDVLACLVHELRELNRALKTEIAGNAAGDSQPERGEVQNDKGN